MNTVEEIQTALGELVAAMTEKSVVTPRAELDIRSHGETARLWLKSDSGAFEGKNYWFTSADHTAEGIAEAIEKARAYIATLPSPEEAVQRKYLTRVASAIDYATEHSLPDEYVAPLRGVSTAMTSNLLSKESAA